MGKVFIKNAKAIVTCDAQDQVFYNCDLLIDGPKLISVGTVIEPDDPRILGAKVIDASGMFYLSWPGEYTSSLFSDFCPEFNNH